MPAVILYLGEMLNLPVTPALRALTLNTGAPRERQ